MLYKVLHPATREVVFVGQSDDPMSSAAANFRLSSVTPKSEWAQELYSKSLLYVVELLPTETNLRSTIQALSPKFNEQGRPNGRPRHNILYRVVRHGQPDVEMTYDQLKAANLVNSTQITLRNRLDRNGGCVMYEKATIETI